MHPPLGLLPAFGAGLRPSPLFPARLFPGGFLDAVLVREMIYSNQLTDAYRVVLVCSSRQQPSALLEVDYEQVIGGLVRLIPLYVCGCVGGGHGAYLAARPGPLASSYLYANSAILCSVRFLAEPVLDLR